MPDEKDYFEFLIKGEGIKPETLSLGELGDIAKGLEKSLTSAMAKTRRKATKADFVVSLVEIRSGSAGLCLRSENNQGTLEKGVGIVAKTVHEGVYEDSSRDIIEGLLVVQKVLDKRDAYMEIIDRSKQTIAVINSKTEFVRPVLLHGSTTIVAHVKGSLFTGRTQFKGRVNLILPNGKTIACDASPEITDELGKRLRKKTKVRGRGGWDIVTKEMKTFQINEILPFRDISLEESLKELGELIGTSQDQLKPLLDSIEKERADD